MQPKNVKKVFIEGFKEPMPVDPLPDVILTDLRGDGDNKLMLYDRTLRSLIVYRNVHREFDKAIEIKNVSGMICYYEEVNRTRKRVVICSSTKYCFGGGEFAVHLSWHERKLSLEGA
jgi:hypothetical protein